MSNHSYVIIRKEKFPTTDIFDGQLREFVDKRFPIFKVERKSIGTDDSWYVGYKDPDDPESQNNFPYARTMWFSKHKGKNCIEFRHATYGGQIMWWIEFEIENYFATMYNGYINDDAFNEKILSRPPQTYIQHCENMYSHVPKFLKKFLTLSEIMSLPKELRKLAREKTIKNI